MERATTTSSSSGYLRTLQVELTRLLGRPAKERANERTARVRSRKSLIRATRLNCRQAGPLCGEAAAASTSSSAAIDKIEKPIPTPTNEEVVETPRKRSWWRRLRR